MISIITSCINRELYLKRMLESFFRVGGWEGIEFEWFLVFQDNAPSDSLNNFIRSLPFHRSLRTGRTDKIEPIGRVIRNCLDRIQYPITLKLDDDCTFMSMDFLPRVAELCEKLPKSIVYPYLVDGETIAPGDERKNQCVYLEKCDLHITVGESPFSSGKYFAPTEMMKQIPFEQQNDAELMRIASLQWHLPVFQAKNGLVIEIQEGLSGQHYRKNLPNGQHVK